MIFEKIKKIFEQRNTLYYPGCITKFVYKNLGDNYRTIFNKIGIDFIELKNLEKCCGSPVTNAGYEKDYKDLIEHNKEVFQESGIKKIITNCPACYKTLKENYPEIEIEHAIIKILKALNNKKLKIKKITDEKITYHDPCHLGRHSGIYEEPRQVLETLGYKIIEMAKNKENSMCCGAGAGLQNNNKELSKKITQMRLKQATDTNAKKLVTCCPMCYHQFKKENKIEVLEVSEVILNGIQ